MEDHSFRTRFHQIQLESYVSAHTILKKNREITTPIVCLMDHCYSLKLIAHCERTSGNLILHTHFLQCPNTKPYSLCMISNRDCCSIMQQGSSEKKWCSYFTGICHLGVERVPLSHCARGDYIKLGNLSSSQGCILWDRLGG